MLKKHHSKITHFILSPPLEAGLIPLHLTADRYLSGNFRRLHKDTTLAAGVMVLSKLQTHGVLDMFVLIIHQLWEPWVVCFGKGAGVSALYSELN